MLKLQVLRYMGILTVMKLSVFAVSIFSLLVAFTWFFVYCPVSVIYAPSPPTKNDRLIVHNPRDHDRLDTNDDYPQPQIKPISDVDFCKKHKGIATEVEEKIVYDTEGENIIPRERYTDQAFERLIYQLNCNDIDGFEKMAESPNLSIYRKPKGNAGLYQYKLYAVIPDANPEQITAVFLDNEYRVSWDAYVTELYVVQENTKGPNVIYFNIDLPWPLANRDYVYAREARRQLFEGTEYTSIVMHSVLQDSIPHVDGVIRVNDYHQSIVMTKYGTNGAQMYIEYYDDPKGSIPTWLVNWAAKTGVPSFLEDLQRASSGLNAYLEKHNKIMLTIPVHT